MFTVYDLLRFLYLLLWLGNLSDYLFLDLQ